MNNNEYENAPADIVDAIERAEVIPDFLPPPDQLVLKEETVRVTLKKEHGFLQVESPGKWRSLPAHDPQSPR